MTPIHFQSLTELSALLKAKKITPSALTELFIQEIETHNKNINAFVTQTFKEARKQAQESDIRYKNSTTRSPLDGIPITLKDVVCTQGIRTTASSRMLENFIPPYNAFVWNRLQDAGCILIGKVNTDEFTMGSSTETSAFGVTTNPHNTQRVSGGSSGGSAAAVAAHFCAGSIGTDTGGSIRQPAHFCGITGLKVSYGRVSRSGVIPMASSLDTVGPLAQTAEDCALLLQIIAGKDPQDATTTDHPVPDYHHDIQHPLKGLRIGIPKEYLEMHITDETHIAFEQTKEILTQHGVELVEVSLPHTRYALPTYYTIAPAEISANMSRFDGIRFGEKSDGDSLKDIYTRTRTEYLGDEVKRRIMTGIYVLSSGHTDQYYHQAQKVRTLIRQDFENAFEHVDALLSPVSPTPAFKVGQNRSPLEMYQEDIFLTPSSLAGVCGISLPVSKTKEEKLPIGMHFMAPAFQESLVLRIAHQIQKEQKRV